MSESFASASEKTGLPPGSLVHVGTVRATETRISVVDYCRDAIHTKIIHSVEELFAYQNTDTVTWVNIEGLSDPRFIESLGRHFAIHPLVLEDILNTSQRPKLEVYEEYLFLVVKAMGLAEDERFVEYEQISLLVLDNFVFTIKEKRDDRFESIKKRLNSGKGRIRNLGPDYLAYVILDTVVDGYFSLLDFVQDTIESVEEELLTHPTRETLAAIQHLNRELITIRRLCSPLRDMVNGLLRCESDLLHPDILIYYRDVYDHVLRVSELVETYREMMLGLLDIFNSSLSNRMNEVMKVLTVFASIFIPLTFIAGIYGMNFEYMPELHWRWAYPVLWVVFVGMFVGFLVYFKKKKWL